MVCLLIQLPNASAYNETCAQIGSFMWNYRRLCATGEARYADVMENALYNGILSGIGIHGTGWFYTNVLRFYGEEHRLLSADSHQRFDPHLRHICCPSNLARTFAGLNNYLYLLTSSGVALNLYASSRFDGILLSGRRFVLTQETDYPWDGRIRLTIQEAPTEPVELCLRIPQWAESVKLRVNSETLEHRNSGNGYWTLNRMWNPGDVVTLDLPMPVYMVEGHPQIESTRSHMAVFRGPILYCLESADLPPGEHVDEIYLDASASFVAKYEPGLLNGVVTLSGEGFRIPRGKWTGLYRKATTSRPQPCTIRLIPYYAWANRGVSEMSVWLPALRN